MSYLIKNSKKTKKINNSYKKYTKELRKYISPKNQVRWMTERTNTKPNLSKKWRRTIFSPDPNSSQLDEIPNEIYLMRKSRRDITRNNLLFKGMSAKDKEIMASKFLELEESSDSSKRRKNILKKQILDNIFFQDLSGDSYSLGSLFNDSKIPDKISNKTIIKLVKKLFGITDKKKKIHFIFNRKTMTNFNIDFNTKNDYYITFLYTARINPIYIILQYS